MNQKHKVNVNHLKFVPKTLLITLKAKYLASCDPSISYKDPYIEQIYEQIEDPIQEAPLFFLFKRGIVSRTKGFDYLLKKEVKNRDTPPTIINLACGLDTRFQRLSEKLGPCQWYDCDLPEVIETRKNFFKETDQQSMKEVNVLNPNWTDSFPELENPIILMEGLSMYLEEGQVQAFFDILSKKFSHYSLILDFISPFFVKKEWVLPIMEQFDVTFTWGAKDGSTFKKFDKDLKCEEELGFIDSFRNLAPFKKILGPIFNKKNMALLKK